MTALQALRRDCVQKRAEYRIARQVYNEVRRLEVPDTAAIEGELKQALVAYYSAHGALHSALQVRAGRTARLH